jgi:hypothetical protein
MRLNRAAGMVCLLGSSLLAWPASALQFEQVPISATEVIVGGRGPIVKGDTTRLEQALAAVPPAMHLSALALDSPGGNVVEGELLAKLIQTRKLSVLIPSNSKCVSACFLLLAASPKRQAAADALVGVHSASESGEETVAALAVTTRMARDAGAMGIPPALIGKMVQTAPGRVEWLTPADLSSMNVSILNDDRATAMRQMSTAGVRQAAPAPPSAPTLASIPPGFTAGSEDRRAWDIWLAGLRGPYRDGAIFAQAQIGLSQPGSCYGPDDTNRGDFTFGCEVARQRLASVVVKFRGNPDYAAGWNGGGPPIPGDEPTEAEYQGAFFCGRQVARLTLKVFPQTDEPRRRALFIFGPQPTSPDVPHGAFLVEGSIDLEGGAISFIPVRWLSQPAGFNWLGLSGSSDDAGKTFGGRIVDNSACSVFTLKRIEAATAAK